MADKDSSKKTSPAQEREDRLKAALKANMAKRKAQSKARTKAHKDVEGDNGVTETGKD
ncbi:MAG: hypothetical protein AAFO72_01775 [Pseudomonadota bacterium]